MAAVAIKIEDIKPLLQTEELWILASYWNSLAEAQAGDPAKMRNREQHRIHIAFSRQAVATQDDGGVLKWKCLDGRLVDPGNKTPVDDLIGYQMDFAALTSDELLAQIKSICELFVSSMLNAESVQKRLLQAPLSEVLAIYDARVAQLEKDLAAAEANKQPDVVEALRQRIAADRSRNVAEKVMIFLSNPMLASQVQVLTPAAATIQLPLIEDKDDTRGVLTLLKDFVGLSWEKTVPDPA